MRAPKTSALPITHTLPIMKFILLALCFLPKSHLKTNPVKTNTLLCETLHLDSATVTYIVTQHLLSRPDSMLPGRAQGSEKTTQPDGLTRQAEGRKSQGASWIGKADLGHPWPRERVVGT